MDPSYPSVSVATLTAPRRIHVIPGHRARVPSASIPRNMIPTVSSVPGSISDEAALSAGPPARSRSLPPAQPSSRLPAFVTCMAMSYQDFKTAGAPEDIWTRTALTSLVLSNDGLGSLCPRVSGLCALKNLDLSGNELVNLPAEIASLVHLEVLDLSHNRFTRVPQSLTRLASLKTLSMSANRLSEMPDEIAGWTSLETLKLSKNELLRLPEGIAIVGTLKVLDLGFNLLSALPAAMADLHRLEDLDLSRNYLTAVPSCVYSLKSLQEFKATRCRIRGFEKPWGKLVVLQSLKKLDLSENELQEIPNELGSLGSLETLNLANNELTSLPSDCSGLVSLKSLDAQNNKLFEFPRALLSCTLLFTLALNFNDISEVPPEVASLTGLRMLQMSGNRIACPLPRLPQGVIKVQEPDPPNEIVRGVMLGSYTTAQNKNLLKRSKITHILTVAPQLRALYPRDFVYKVLAVDDDVDAPLLPVLRESISFIQGAIAAGGSVLVHCAAGISRSPAVVIAYLIAVHHMSYNAATALVKSKRPVIAPNPGFIEQLTAFEKKLRSRRGIASYCLMQ